MYVSGVILLISNLKIFYFYRYITLLLIYFRMKIHTSMPEKLKPFFSKELENAKIYFLNHDYRTSWHHLERAHILGQPYPYHHTLVHWKMLLFGIKIKDIREIIGQIPRLLIGGVKSFVGEVPVGNTGGVNVSPLKRMEIPGDLKNIIEEYK
ncbi:MAG: hypothetical protein RIQ47_668 [Bacteroidota bacterium]|jgi:hypothetical protein